MRAYTLNQGTVSGLLTALKKNIKQCSQPHVPSNQNGISSSQEDTRIPIHDELVSPAASQIIHAHLWVAAAVYALDWQLQNKDENTPLNASAAVEQNLNDALTLYIEELNKILNDVSLTQPSRYRAITQLRKNFHRCIELLQKNHFNQTRPKDIQTTAAWLASAIKTNTQHTANIPKHNANQNGALAWKVTITPSPIFTEKNNLTEIDKLTPTQLTNSRYPLTQQLTPSQLKFILTRKESFWYKNTLSVYQQQLFENLGAVTLGFLNHNYTDRNTLVLAHNTYWRELTIDDGPPKQDLVSAIPLPIHALAKAKRSDIKKTFTNHIQQLLKSFLAKQQGESDYQQQFKNDFGIDPAFIVVSLLSPTKITKYLFSVSKHVCCTSDIDNNDGALDDYERMGVNYHNTQTNTIQVILGVSPTNDVAAFSQSQLQDIVQYFNRLVQENTAALNDKQHPNHTRLQNINRHVVLLQRIKKNSPLFDQFQPVVIRFMCEEINLPCLIHCKSSKDRRFTIQMLIDAFRFVHYEAKNSTDSLALLGDWITYHEINDTIRLNHTENTFGQALMSVLRASQVDYDYLARSGGAQSLPEIKTVLAMLGNGFRETWISRFQISPCLSIVMNTAIVFSAISIIILVSSRRQDIGKESFGVICTLCALLVGLAFTELANPIKKALFSTSHCCIKDNNPHTISDMLQPYMNIPKYKRPKNRMLLRVAAFSPVLAILLILTLEPVTKTLVPDADYFNSTAEGDDRKLIYAVPGSLLLSLLVSTVYSCCKKCQNSRQYERSVFKPITDFSTNNDQKKRYQALLTNVKEG